ncbi:hypothetical protein AB0O42_05515 [Streptomyces sp. NPDC089922]|uniref:hypothetical protein n=1 Tax=Streptomyces sp. NPDC089922 TaxID=3155189 RepID=UPI00341C0A87
MERDYKIKDTPFTHWLMERAREAGWDLDGDEEGRKTLRLTAALIRTSGIAVVNTAKLAEALNVSVKDIEAAVHGELSTNERMARILDSEEVGELDAELDEIAWPSGQKGD